MCPARRRSRARSAEPDIVALDPLGDDPQTQVVGQIDGRAHQHVVGAGEQAGDEGAIDLQLVDRKTPQVASDEYPLPKSSM